MYSGARVCAMSDMESQIQIRMKHVKPFALYCNCRTEALTLKYEEALDWVEHGDEVMRVVFGSAQVVDRYLLNDQV